MHEAGVPNKVADHVRVNMGVMTPEVDYRVYWPVEDA